MTDPLDTLGVQLAADHQAAKRQRKKATPETATVGDTEGQANTTPNPDGPVEDDGKAEMREAVDSLGKSVEEHGQDEKPNLVAERIERIQAEAPIDARYLSGDLFAVMLDLFKTRGKPWSEMLEDDQRQVGMAIKAAVDAAMGRAVHAVRGGGAGSFVAKLEGYTNKGAFKINLTAEATRDTSNALFDAEGQFVTVQRADPAQFSGTRPGTEPQFEPDQGGLGFESDNDHKPADPFTDTNAIQDADRDPADRDSDLADDDLDDDQDPA